VPLSEVATYAGQVRGVTGARGDLGVAIERVQSDSLTLRWQGIVGATDYEVRLASDPPAEDGSTPSSISLGHVDAKSPRTFEVKNLAADAQVFLQVFADRGAGKERVWGAVNVHLPSRPGVMKDAGSLIGVHASAPDVLTLVIRQEGLEPAEDGLEDNRGKDWQAGRWEVTRAGGQKIGVERAQRHSVVAGEQGLEIGFGGHSRPTANVEHRIHLRLREAIGQSEVLRVVHKPTGSSHDDTALDVRVPFSDKYTETPVIQLNQVGYNPRATERFAYVYGWLGDGGGLDLGKFPRQAEVLVEPRDGLAPRSPLPDKVALTAREESQADVGSSVLQINLASVPPHEGRRYRVRVPGVGVSYPTAVSERASFKAFYTVARGLFHNRWCGDLRAELTEWSRPPDHCSAYFVGGSVDGFFDQETPRKNSRPLRGGHHDAGDFDIRPMHVLVAQALLRAFEMAPARFSDGQLALPESGNGIPDLLDEALWSVAGWEDLQEPDGSVRLGVESTRHPAGYYFAHEDELPYFAFDATAAHTAYVAGLFAQAAYLVAPFDSERGKHLLERARRAYAYASKGDAPDTYLAYAAGEISRAGRDAAARADYERLWAVVDANGRGLLGRAVPAAKVYPGSIYEQHPAMLDFSLAYFTGDSPNALIRDRTRFEVERRADAAADSLIVSAQPHRSGRPPGVRPDWGMDVSQGRLLDGVYQRLELAARGAELPSPKRQRYLNAMSLAADYMLGANPLGMSFITGLGSRSPEQPLHSDSLAFQLTRDLPPMPGLVVYGPVENLPRAAYYKPVALAFYPAFERQPRALRYADAVQSVNTSEFSVWESQAPTALLFAALLGPDMKPWPELAPGESEHRSPLVAHTAD
jgi:endoglucanase